MIARFAAALILALFWSSAGAGADEAAPPACAGTALNEAPGLAAAEAKRADDLLNGDGLYWRIDKPGLAPSYLYGTIHSTDEAAMAIARRAAAGIDGATAVATELGGPLDSLDKANLAAGMFAKALVRDRDSYAGALSEADGKALDDLLKARGFPTDLAHHLQLWFLALLTAMPECEAKREMANLPEVDNFLAETAKAKGVRVVGLETATEQTEAIAAMKPDLAATLLSAAVRNPELTDNVYFTLLKLYRDSQPARIVPILDVATAMTDKEKQAEDEFNRLLLVGRNETMAKRAAPLLSAGGAFIAVGALHLSGKTGLVALFRKAGYRVEKMW